MPRVILAFDGGSRLYAMVHPLGYGRAWPWAAVMVALFGVDLLKAAAVRRSGRLLLLPRLVIDLADLTVCSLAMARMHTPLDLAVLTGIPLAFDTSVRRGAVGLAIPAAHVAFGLVFLHGLRQEAVLQFSTSIALATLMGWSINNYSRRREVAFRREHDRFLAARLSAVSLAVRNEVLAAAGSIIDVIQRTGVLLEISGTPSAVRRAAAGQKQELAEQTRREATYFADAALAWQQRHNAQPDLSQMAVLEVAPRDGTAVLTHAQVRNLWVALGALELRGRVPIGFAEGSSHRLEADRVVLVGDHRIVLPGTGERVRWLANGAPVVVGLLGIWTLGPVMYGMTTFSLTAPFALAGLLLALHAHRQLVRDEEQVYAVWRLATSLLAVYAVAIGVLTPWHHVHGSVAVFPALLPMEFQLLLSSVAWPWFSSSQRRRVVLGSLALWVLAGASAGLPFQLRPFLADTILPGIMLTAFAAFGFDLVRVVQDRRVALGQDDEVKVQQVRHDTRETVLGELRASRAALAEELRAMEGHLGRDVAAEARRRLATVDRRLADLNLLSG